MKLQGSKVERIRPYHGYSVSNISAVARVSSPFLRQLVYSLVNRIRKIIHFDFSPFQSKYDSLITQLRTEMQHERETYAVERHKLASHLEQALKESKDFSSLLRQREEVGRSRYWILTSRYPCRCPRKFAPPKKN